MRHIINFKRWLLASLLLLTCALLHAETTTFTYTATHKLDRFDENSYFAGADGVVSHDFDEATGTGTVVYDGTVTELKSYCLQWNSDLTSIVIPEGVTVIGFQAFYMCTSLSHITLPKTLTRVKNGAFYGCKFGEVFVIDDLAWWCGITFETIDSNPISKSKHIFSDETTEITHLVIPEGVTSIGPYAFCYCEGITSLTLPESLANIGNNAFYYCTNLEALDIPSGVTEIEQSTFANCSKLERVTIPEGVAKIGQMAFQNTGIRNLTLPSTIREMSQSFYNCDSLVSLTLTEGITTLGSSFYNCDALPAVHIPSSVKQMQSSDFSNCTSLETVTIAEGVENVTGFNGCTKLSSINIPSTATSVTSFNQCPSLTSIYVPKSVTAFDGFKDCTGLKKVIIEDLASWCNILFSSYASYNAQYYAQHLYIGTPEDNEEIINLVIPEGVTQLKRYAFNNLKSIASVTLPSTLTNLDNTAFSDCSGVDNVYAPCDPNKLSWSGGGFKAGKATLCHVTDTAAWLGKFPDANVTFVDDMTQIHYTATERVDAFDNNINFIGSTGVLLHNFDVETGKGVVTYYGEVAGIGENALAGCSTLTTIILPEGVRTIASHAFLNCTGLTTLSIPSTTTLIQEGAFEGAVNITDVTCCAPLEGLTWNGSESTSQFKPAKATLFHVDDAETWLERFPDANVTFASDLPRISYTATSKMLVFEDVENFIGSTAVVSHTFDPQTGKGSVIYDKLTEIKNYAFNHNKELTGIVIPNCVTKIGQSVFNDCANLVEVCLPDSLETIGTWTFYQCKSLTTVNIPSKLPSVVYYMFGYCTSLADIDIPETVTRIDDDAFCGCTALTQIYIPASVTRMGNDAFYNCTGLEKVITPSLDAWCNIDFVNTNSNPLKNAHHLYVGDKESNEEIVGRLVVPEGVTELKPHVFLGLATISSVEIPEGVTGVGAEAFRDCTSLTEIEFPEGLTNLGYRAMYNCTDLKAVILPSTVTDFSSDVFENTSNVTDVFCYLTLENAKRVYGFRYLGNNSMLPNKQTLCHVDDAEAWLAEFPNVNMTFVDDLHTFTLPEDADNSMALWGRNGRVCDVTLGRTLMAGSYNAFAAPFDIDASSLTTYGMTAKKLDSTTLAEDVLTLTFAKANTVEAGKPCIVKVNATVENPTFEGVTVSKATTVENAEHADFVPTVSKVLMTGAEGNEDDAHSVMLLGDDDTFAHPAVVNDDTQDESFILGFRSYLRLHDAEGANVFLMEFKEIVGDVNCDGQVNVTDVNLAVSDVLSHQGNPACDINGDGQVNVTDINLIVSIILQGKK